MNASLQQVLGVLMLAAGCAAIPAGLWIVFGDTRRAALQVWAIAFVFIVWMMVAAALLDPGCRH